MALWPPVTLALPMRCLVSAVLGFGLALRAEEPALEVNPNRPTFATPALTTQPGVAELEWGLQHSQFKDESKAFLTPALLKFGLAQDLEFRLGTNGFLRQADPSGGHVSGWGDATTAIQWCYLRDGAFGMAQAVQILHKFPTASAAKGLGSGAGDDLAMLLFSRDAGAQHFDINLLESWLGKAPEEGGGHVRQAAGTVSVSHGFGARWSLTGELYAVSGTAKNPRIVSNLWAVDYKVSSRMVLDCGVDLGLTHGAQRYSLVAGLTVGLARFPRPWAR
jgi:hypothetical protein